MPPLVRRYIKTAIAFLLLGLLLGLALSAAVHVGWGRSDWQLVVAHTHLINVGFLMMLIMGVALWMFPKPREGDARYRPSQMELAWWLVALGVVARTTGEIASTWSHARWLHVLILASSGLEVLGMITFFTGLWPRIRSPREDWARNGERSGAAAESNR